MSSLGPKGLLGGAVPTARTARGAGLVTRKTDSVPLSWRDLGVGGGRNPILLVHFAKKQEEELGFRQSSVTEETKASGVSNPHWSLAPLGGLGSTWKSPLEKNREQAPALEHLSRSSTVSEFFGNHQWNQS